MQENVSPPRRLIGRTQTLFETAVKAGFDHLIKGDVIIKKLKKKHQYKIIFSKVYGDRFFFYQVFNKDNTDSVNDQRFASYIPIKNIVNLYNDTNNNNKLFNQPLFTPTTIMELPNFSKYAFVINKVYFNSHKRLVFMISTKEINLQNTSSKKLTQIPCGKFKHVRFDVDPLDPYLSKTLDDLWTNIKNECGKNNKSTTFLNIGDNITNFETRLCDIPMPASPPDECNGLSFYFSLTDPPTGGFINVDSTCFKKLENMIDNNLLPEIFTTIIIREKVPDVLGFCNGQTEIPYSFLFFSYDNSTPMKDEVINISITGVLAENYSIDLANYVVANSNFNVCTTKSPDPDCVLINVKQIYEISENTTNVTLNGSILTIKNKNIPGSCTLTVRQKYINNLEISIKLRWNWLYFCYPDNKNDVLFGVLYIMNPKNNINVSDYVVAVDNNAIITYEISNVASNATATLDNTKLTLSKGAGSCTLTARQTSIGLQSSINLQWDQLYFCYPENKSKAITGVLNNIKIQYPSIKVGNPYIYLYNYTNYGLGDDITYEISGISGEEDKLAKIKFNPPYILNFIQKGPGSCILTAIRGYFKTSIILKWDLCGGIDAKKIWCV